MKLLKYTFIGIVALLVLNLLTFYVFGKQSLRERNISEILKMEFENKHDVVREYYLLSELNDTSSLIIDKKSYPTFIVDRGYEIKKQRYVDSVELWKEFRLDLEVADSILSIDLDSIYRPNLPAKKSTIYDSIFRVLTIASMDSISFLNEDTGFDGTCNYDFGRLDCIVFGNHVYGLVEEFETFLPMYVDQLLSFWLDGTHVYQEKEEKLIWIFFTWVQIEWIDGNGLGVD